MNTLIGELLRTGDTATATFTRHHDTDPADLWDAVTSPERLARWFAPVTGDLVPGGDFVIHFDDADTPSCRVVSCDARRGYVWEWRHTDGASRVSVEVSADGDGSLLRLEHTLLPVASAPDYAAGWDAYVQSLTAYLTGAEGGDWWDAWNATRAAYAEVF